MKLAIIGLDTSHSIEFTRLIQGDAPAERKVKGLEIISCMRFPSPFQAESGQDDRQKILEGWGVKVTTSFEEAIKGAEGLLLEINDPDLHLKYFEMAAETGKPIFLDKPLAGNMKDGFKICEITKKKNLKVWSSSSLRFTPEISAAVKNTPSPVFCNVFGAMGKAPAGSSLIWYGVHSFEMLAKIMGKGAVSVSAKKDSKGIVSIVEYSDGRRGIVECNENNWKYGGRAHSAEAVNSFLVGPDTVLYYHLMLEIKEFFMNGKIPVDMDETLEILSVMCAAEKSVASGKEEKVEMKG